ncbi:FecR domain-containing protein [Acidovorax radicis]|uniref:FecR domain-containing protein n=1 Tax=Acidovorax radicis TaxID=758826 RepID=UPI001CFA2620|nr:FecR domain-containing protein [Acidovorax radicis]
MATPELSTRYTRNIPHAATALAAFTMVALASLGGQGALAATNDEQTDELAHTVKDGDTLEGLARSYLAAPRQWPLLQARNKVANPRHLLPGSVIWIPVRLQPSEFATVQFVQGRAQASPPASASAVGRANTAAIPIKAGGRLQEGTRLQVGPESFVAVQLADGTVVRVQANSDLRLRQLRRRGRAGSVQSVLEIQKGGVESTVPPNTDSLRRFEIRTPLAVTSVRGTHFNVGIADAGQTTAAVLRGSVAVQSLGNKTAVGDESPPSTTALLEPGQGLAVTIDGSLGAPRALLLPPDLSDMPGAVGDAGLLAIDIPPVPGARRYEAQVAQDEQFIRVVRLGSFADGHLRWKEVDDGSYYLMVRAVDEQGITGLPAIQPFKVKTRPVAPLYRQPAPSAVVASGGSAELMCTEVQGVRWYRVQVATNAKFAPLLRDEQRLNECRLPIGTLPAGAYFWRVASLLQAAHGQTDQGPFAPPQAFTIADRPAALSLQAVEAQDGDTTVHLHWPALPGQRFNLQLVGVADPTFGQSIQDVTLDAPEWTASGLAAGEYLVRIRVLDPSGLQSDFSTPRKIRVGSGIRTESGLPVSTSGGEPVRRP